MNDEEEGLINQSVPSKLLIFGFMPLVFPKRIKLTLFNWKKCMILAWSFQAMLFVSLCGLMKPPWEIYSKFQ